MRGSRHQIGPGISTATSSGVSAASSSSLSLPRDSAINFVLYDVFGVNDLEKEQPGYTLDTAAPNVMQ